MTNDRHKATPMTADDAAYNRKILIGKGWSPRSVEIVPSSPNTVVRDGPAAGRSL